MSSSNAGNLDPLLKKCSKQSKKLKYTWNPAKIDKMVTDHIFLLFLCEIMRFLTFCGNSSKVTCLIFTPECTITMLAYLNMLKMEGPDWVELLFGRDHMIDLGLPST